MVKVFTSLYIILYSNHLSLLITLMGASLQATLLASFMKTPGTLLSFSKARSTDWVDYLVRVKVAYCKFYEGKTFDLLRVISW